MVLERVSAADETMANVVVKQKTPDPDHQAK